MGVNIIPPPPNIIWPHLSIIHFAEGSPGLVLLRVSFDSLLLLGVEACFRIPICGGPKVVG